MYRPCGYTRVTYSNFVRKTSNQTLYSAICSTNKAAFSFSAAQHALPLRYRTVKGCLNADSVPILEWPAESPDLSPIAHLYDQLRRRIRRRNPQPRSIRELKDGFIEEWVTCPQENTVRLIRSMNNRSKECVPTRGGHISY